MQLRPYQSECVAATFAFLDKQQGNPLIAMPTGTGKSLVIAGICQRGLATWPHLRVLILTHVKELIAQNHAKLLDLWPMAPAGIYSAGLSRRELSHAITFGGIASIHTRAEEIGHVNLIIIDECHMISPKGQTMYRKFISALLRINPHLRVVGLSATIFRMGLGLLTEDDLFTDVAYDITGWQAFNQLVADGYLAPLITKKTVQQFDISHVHVASTGDYDAHELQQAMDQGALTRAAIDEVETLGADRQSWLLFASGVDHAAHVCDELKHRGITATYVHGALKAADRDARIADFKSGKYRAMVNNNVLTTGFDHPAIDLIAMLRPTKSAGLWVQMLGRGTRPSPGKRNCLVLDFAGNAPRLGPINDPVIPRPKNRGNGVSVGIAPCRLCPTCMIYQHITVRVCPDCGYEFPLHFQERFSATSGTADVMRDDTSIEQHEFEVDSVEFYPHEKEGKPLSVCATYRCGMRRFREWITLNHKSNGLARRWLTRRWRVMVDDEEAVPPSHAMTTEWLLANAHSLPVPSHLSVWTNKKPYPEIIGVRFDAPPIDEPERQAFECDDIPF